MLHAPGSLLLLLVPLGLLTENSLGIAFSLIFLSGHLSDSCCINLEYLDGLGFECRKPDIRRAL
jgi:hypothetical protein